jgi:fumarate hydratase subunit beta
MIGKGLRSKEVTKSIKKNKAIYFAAIGGAAALIAKSIKKSKVIAYEDLGAEAVFRFYVKDFPAIVVVDSAGNNLYGIEPPKYKKQ